MPRKNLLAFLHGTADQGPRTSIQASSPTAIATAAGNTDFYFTSPEDGYLESVEFAGSTFLAGSDTNYITFSVTNLGQAGAGATAMLAATDVNTTKATGGSAIVQDGRRDLTLTSTLDNLKVAEGDRIRVRLTVTGTLGNTVASPVVMMRFN